MPQTNNIITPVQRLMIAAQIAAAIATSSIFSPLTDMPVQHHEADNIACNSLFVADSLIEQPGCIVEGEVVLEHEMD